MSEIHAVVYRELRARVSGIVEGLDPSDLERVAPATPEWTVHDVLSHLVGVPDDVVNGRLEGLASEAWTAAQVERRRSSSAADLIAEWDDYGAQFETMLAAAPGEIVGQAIFDAATHEHDICNAIGIHGERDSDAVSCGWDWIVDARTRGGATAICFVVESGEQVWGVGDPVARVEASRFEFFRAVSGRRTAAEIARYGWDREPDPNLLLAADFFSIPDQSIGE